MSALNEVTNTSYQGRNVIRLCAAESEHSYDDSRGWAGYKQWLTVGRVVRKGEHGTPCMTVVTVGDEEHRTTKPRGFRVFHYDQTVQLDGSEPAPDTTVHNVRVEVEESEPEDTYSTPNGRITHKRIGF
jgi:antirestriction protein ArdC